MLKRYLEWCWYKIKNVFLLGGGVFLAGLFVVVAVTLFLKSPPLAHAYNDTCEITFSEIYTVPATPPYGSYQARTVYWRVTTDDPVITSVYSGGNSYGWTGPDGRGGYYMPFSGSISNVPIETLWTVQGTNTTVTPSHNVGCNRTVPGSGTTNPTDPTGPCTTNCPPTTQNLVYESFMECRLSGLWRVDNTKPDKRGQSVLGQNPVMITSGEQLIATANPVLRARARYPQSTDYVIDQTVALADWRNSGSSSWMIADPNKKNGSSLNDEQPFAPQGNSIYKLYLKNSNDPNIANINFSGITSDFRYDIERTLQGSAGCFIVNDGSPVPCVVGKESLSVSFPRLQGGAGGYSLNGPPDTFSKAGSYTTVGQAYPALTRGAVYDFQPAPPIMYNRVYFNIGPTTSAWRGEVLNWKIPEEIKGLVAGYPAGTFLFAVVKEDGKVINNTARPGEYDMRTWAGEYRNVAFIAPDSGINTIIRLTEQGMPLPALVGMANTNWGDAGYTWERNGYYDRSNLLDWSQRAVPFSSEKSYTVDIYKASPGFGVNTGLSPSRVQDWYAGNLQANGTLRNAERISSCDYGTKKEPPANRPYLKVDGADVVSGAAFGDSNNCAVTAAAQNAAIKTNGYFENKDSKGFSGTQYGVFASGASGGLDPNTFLANSGFLRSNARDLNFANVFGTNTNKAGEFYGSSGTIPCVNLNVEKLKAAARATNSTTTGAVFSAATVEQKRAMSGTIHITGDVTLGAMDLMRGNKTFVVDGNVTINSNITYQPNSAPTSLPYVRIIANNIYIRSSVTQIDAHLVAYPNAAVSGSGVLDTCGDGAWPADLKLVISSCERPLAINGSVIARRVLWKGTRGTVGEAADVVPGYSCRHGAANTSTSEAGSNAGCAAEYINFSAESYIARFRAPQNQKLGSPVSTVELPPIY